MAQLQEVAQLDFSGGVNAVTNPYAITQKQVSRVRNMTLDEHGSLRTRDGYSVVTTSPDTTNPLVYRGVLNTTSAGSVPFALQNNGTVNTVYRTNSDPWTTVGTTSTPYTTPQSFTVIDQEFLVLGYETPKLYNGTTLTNITATAGQTVPPGAKHGVFHLSSVWVWNTNATTTTLDGPSSLRMSDANTPNSWPNANQTFVSKDDGQVGMGLATYTIVETGISPTSTLVAFKNYSAYQVVSVFGASNFSVQKIKSDMGCVAPRTIQFASGFGIIRLTHKGFALYDGVNDKLISEEIRPYIFGASTTTETITGLNATAIDRSWASQSQNPPLYIAACPVNGNVLSRFFIYDLVRRAWTICDFPINFNCLALFETPTTSPVVHGGRDTSGQIVALFNAAQDDNGTPIDWSFRTRSFSAGSPLRPAYWRRFIVDLIYKPTQNVTVQSTLGGLTPLTQTVTYTGSTGASLYGSAIYGTSVYGASGRVESRRSFDILRIAPNAFFDVSGSGFVTVRGIGSHISQKPLTRMAS